MKSGLYKALIGRVVLVPGSEFGVDVPELYYKARVVRKDPSHARAVVMRFAEDGDLMWQPVDKVWAWIETMQAKGLSEDTPHTIGDAANAYAVATLAGISCCSNDWDALDTAAVRSCTPEPGTVTRLVSSASSEQSDNSWVDADMSTPMEQECGQVLGSIRLSPRKQREAAPRWQPQATRAPARQASR
ncbi:g9799 [Coccomyxa viridis]|uniref:G9799 protein n=1 Tax=Coccomyxa viridis TaxID=1274662 RepID=A0ABP1G6H7_9CHLO